MVRWDEYFLPIKTKRQTDPLKWGGKKKPRGCLNKRSLKTAGGSAFKPIFRVGWGKGNLPSLELSLAGCVSLSKSLSI